MFIFIYFIDSYWYIKTAIGTSVQTKSKQKQVLQSMKVKARHRYVDAIFESVMKVQNQCPIDIIVGKFGVVQEVFKVVFVIASFALDDEEADKIQLEEKYYICQMKRRIYYIQQIQEIYNLCIIRWQFQGQLDENFKDNICLLDVAILEFDIYQPLTSWGNIPARTLSGISGNLIFIYFTRIHLFNVLNLCLIIFMFYHIYN